MKVTENADGTYTFTMPNGQVTVKATFVETEEPAPAEPFPDVDENDWFYDYVVGAIKYGWITGYSDGRFGPYDTITRAQVTTIVNRMLDRSADEAYVDRHADELEQFTDVPDTHWAYYEVAEATNAHDYDRTSGSEDWTQLW